MHRARSGSSYVRSSRLAQGGAAAKLQMMILREIWTEERRSLSGAVKALCSEAAREAWRKSRGAEHAERCKRARRAYGEAARALARSTGKCWLDAGFGSSIGEVPCEPEEIPDNRPIEESGCA